MYDKIHYKLKKNKKFKKKKIWGDTQACEASGRPKSSTLSFLLGDLEKVSPTHLQDDGKDPLHSCCPGIMSTPSACLNTLLVWMVKDMVFLCYLGSGNSQATVLRWGSNKIIHVKVLCQL